MSVPRRDDEKLKQTREDGEEGRAGAELGYKCLARASHSDSSGLGKQFDRSSTMENHYGMFQQLLCFLAIFLTVSVAFGGGGKVGTLKFDSSLLRSVVDKNMNQPKADAWSYTCIEDTTGPSHWAELSVDYSLCSSGKAQSPISIESFNLKVDESLPPLDLTYDNSADYVNATVLNDGHAVKIIREGGSLVFRGVNYSLTEFHLHTPSEHTVDGKFYPMEMHLTHVSDSGAIAIVGAFFELSADDNSKLNQYFPLFPHLKVGQPVHDVISKIIATPKDMFTYYVYEGSLSEPPCTENVLYTIIKQVYSLSPRQVMWLQEAVYGHNNRPIQPLNARTVYTTKYFKK